MKFRFLLLIALLLVTRAASAQWVQTNGPYGGGGGPFVTMGSILFSGDYRSLDSGKTWKIASPKNANFQISSLAVMGSTLIAGSDSGIYLSTDSGVTWTTSNTGLLDTNVQAVAVMGSDIFVTSSLDANNLYESRIFMSSDSGRTWVIRSNSIEYYPIYSLVICETNLFAGTDGGIIRSSDSGSTWVSTSAASNNSVFSIATEGSIIFASAGGYFPLSTDGGATWQYPKLPYTTNYPSVGVVGTTLYANSTNNGIYRSTDSGKSWVRTGSGPTNFVVYNFGGTETNLLIGTLWSGIFRSADSGVTWNVANNGIPETDVRALAVIGSDVFAGTWGDGTFRTTDRGNSWNMNSLALSLDYVWTLATNDGYLFVGTEGGGVHQSSDSGVSWTTTGGYKGGDVEHLASYGTNIFANYFWTRLGDTNWIEMSRVLYCIVPDGNLLFAGTDSGVFISLDSGIMWQSTSSELAQNSIGALAFIGTNLFAGTDSGIFISRDNGNTWTPANSGLSDSIVNSFAVFDSDIFACTYDHIYLSKDFGSSWAAVDSGLRGLQLRVITATDQDLYAGTYGAGVWRRPLSEMINTSSVSEAPQEANAITVFPNPVSETANINFILQESSNTNITIFDILGNPVVVLFEGTLMSGAHSFKWNANAVPAGTYYARIEEGSGVQTVKIVKN